MPVRCISICFLVGGKSKIWKTTESASGEGATILLEGNMGNACISIAHSHHEFESMRVFGNFLWTTCLLSAYILQLCHSHIKKFIFICEQSETSFGLEHTPGKQNELVADPTDWPLIIRFLAHLILGLHWLGCNRLHPALQQPCNPTAVKICSEYVSDSVCNWVFN